jgi:hypothetical protein
MERLSHELKRKDNQLLEKDLLPPSPPSPVEEEPGPKEPPTPTDDNDTDDVAPPPSPVMFLTTLAIGRLLWPLTSRNQRLKTSI